LARKKENDPTVLARKALDVLWNEADLRGRCWGLKKAGNNPYAKTNITVCIGNELVSISRSQKGDKKLIVHEFTKSEGTKLGNRVRDILEKEGLLQN
jgi:hypothetical protein